MSRENVEIVRRMWEAFLGDDSMSGLSFCDPEIEWDGTNLPDGKVARGPVGVGGLPSRFRIAQRPTAPRARATYTPQRSAF
jgi:hypothetical protein